MHPAFVGGIFHVLGLPNYHVIAGQNRRSFIMKQLKKSKKREKQNSHLFNTK